MQHGYFSSVQSVDKGGLKVQGHLQLRRTLEASMRYREKERQASRSSLHIENQLVRHIKKAKRFGTERRVR